MEKWMIVYLLPLEVWMDIYCFPWISRAKFGQFVAKIGNLKFAEHAQFYLHEWSKRKLGPLSFDQYGFQRLRSDNEPYLLNLDVPQTPIPENIKSFDHIWIHHFDAKTMDFLTRINSLLTDTEINVQLVASKYYNNLRKILTSLAQLIDGRTWSLQCDDYTLPVLRQCISREQFTKLKVLKFDNFCAFGDAKMVRENVNTIVDWLNQPADEPKFRDLIILYSDNYFSEQFATEIRQQFLTAKNPSTFGVNVRTYRPITEFHLENEIGEQLHGAYVEDGRAFQITRHSAGCNMEQLHEWIKENMKEKSQNVIQIINPTIGSFDVPQMDVPHIAEEQDEQQPSTSKQA